MSHPGRKIFVLAASALLAAGCQQGEETNQSNAVAGNQAQPAELPDRTIAQTLAGSGQHSTLVSAVKAAGLEATLSGAQPYTLFAPTNAAFQALPNNMAQSLLQEESRGQLTGILTYHIVPGAVTAADLGRAIEQGDGRTEIATIGGGNLTVSRNGDAIVISDGSGGQARVTQADMLQANGVVHVIDKVLVPGQPAAPTQ